MMRFLRKGDCYALNKPINKYYYQPLYSFKCLLLSLSNYYYQFSCNVQESRASGTTGYAARLVAALARVIQVLRTVYKHKRSNVDTCLTHERHNNHTCLTHEPHMNETTNCGKEVGIGNEQAGVKQAWGTASVLRFNTLLIHCYYFTHTWLILRPYTKVSMGTDEVGIKRGYSRLGLLTIFCVLFSFASVVEVHAQELRQGGATGQELAQSLRVGDKVPEELWHLPLQVVNHPEGKETITLNDYRGKGLIMLDFMSTGCSGCVKALPAMEKVAGGFDGEVVVLPVTHEQAERMRSFRKHNHLLKDSELTYVVEDNMLKKYFPHQYISHLVWIDKDGVIKAFTNTSQVRDFTVTDFLNGRAGDWVVKTETTDFFNDQLVMLNPKAETLIHNVDAPLAYAAFSGFLEGVGPYYQTEIDTLRGVERVSLRNISLFDFGLISLGLGIYKRGIIFQQNTANWQVEHPERYAYELADANLTTRSAWEQQHAICYERTFPLGISKEEKYKNFRQDLENLLGIKVDQEEKNDTIQLMFTENANYK